VIRQGKRTSNLLGKIFRLMKNKRLDNTDNGNQLLFEANCPHT